MSLRNLVSWLLAASQFVLADPQARETQSSFTIYANTEMHRDTFNSENDNLVAVHQSSNFVLSSYDGGDSWTVVQHDDGSPMRASHFLQKTAAISGSDHLSDSAFLVSDDTDVIISFVTPFSSNTMIPGKSPIKSLQMHPLWVHYFGIHYEDDSFTSAGFDGPIFTQEGIKECVLDPIEASGEWIWCALLDSGPSSGALVHARKNFTEPVMIDDKPLNSVTKLHSNSEWLVALTENSSNGKRIYARYRNQGGFSVGSAEDGSTTIFQPRPNALSADIKSWHLVESPYADSVEFLQLDIPQVIASATRDGQSYLWTLSSDGMSFKEQPWDRSANIHRVEKVLLAQSESATLASSNYGRTWIELQNAASNIDLSTLQVTRPQQLIIALSKDKNTLLYSYDGLNWRSLSVPVQNGQCLLIDSGSSVLCSNSNSAFLSVGPELDKWEKVQLPLDEYDILHETYGRPALLVARKQPLGESPSAKDLVESLTKLDLSTYFEGACTTNDVMPSDSNSCILGQHRNVMIRNKGNKCFMGMSGLRVSQIEPCGCQIDDYDCSAGYEWVDGKCMPSSDLLKTLGICDQGSKRPVSPPYTLNPQSSCVGGMTISNEYYYDCDSGELVDSAESLPTEPSGDIIVSSDETPAQVFTHPFTSKIKDYMYLPGSLASVDDETILVWTHDGELYVSYDQGAYWTLQDIKNVVEVFKSTTDDNQVYVFTEDSVNLKKVWVSWDRAKKFRAVALPTEPNAIFGVILDFMAFNPLNPDWIMYTGKDTGGCEGLDCLVASFISKNKGKTWNKVSTGECKWVYGLADQDPNDELVYCMRIPSDLNPGLGGDEDDDQPRFYLDLYWSRDYFKSGDNQIEGLERTLGSVIAGKYMVVLAVVGKDRFEQVVTRDGLNYRKIKYPVDIKPSIGLTLLTFDKNSLWLFETVSSKHTELFGTIMKSDSTGTEYIEVLSNVNRASGFYSGYADFDRLESVEGVATANVVTNSKEVLRSGAQKKLQTLITHSDGARWAPLSMPGGKSLQLHGYTDRLDVRNKPSSPTAIGVLMGRGNIGESLGDLRSSQTYMSRDAGLTWKKVADRPMFWEFGDSGSIVVLVDSMEPTDTVRFSTDGGETWNDFKFSGFKIKIINLVTMPSDTSRKFVIFGTPPLGHGDGTIAIQLNFGYAPECRDEDFEWWQPEHPQIGSKCLLGHEIEYLRKIPGRRCTPGKFFSDPKKQPDVQHRIKNCKCTDLDLECDLNYERDAAGKCILIPDAPEPNKENQCADGSIAYRNINGYRKIAASTCEGIESLLDDKLYACPGKEGEFKKQYGDGRGGNGGNSGNGGDSDNGNGNDNDQKKGGRSILGSLVLYTFLIFIFVAGGITIYTLYIKGRQLRSISLSESEYPQQAMHASLDVAQKVFVHAAGLWNLVRSNIPFFGKWVPQDHLGFYSRMNDDERYRILEEGDDFEDESGDEDSPLFNDDMPLDEPTSFEPSSNDHNTDSLNENHTSSE